MKTKYVFSILAGLLILAIDFLLFKGTFLFFPLVIIALTVSWSLYWIDFFVRNQQQKELEEKFPEFVRNLVGSVKSGMPISQAIVHVSRNDYGSLSQHVKKLANQLEWAIPLHRALTTFANETNNRIIKRAVATVIEAEQSGGDIEEVLESITTSLVEIKKIKEQRRANIQSQITQGYILFFVFLVVVIVIQNVLIPYLSNVNVTPMQVSEEDIGTVASNPFPGVTGKISISYESPERFILTMSQWFKSLNGVLLMLSVIQGFFAGIVLGKLAEGDLTSGLKHSLILITIAVLVITLAQGL